MRRHRLRPRHLVLGAAAAVAAAGVGAAVLPGGTNPITADVPGVTDARVTQSNIQETICVSGYTATVRPPTSYTNPLKLRLLAAHGYTKPPSAYELDHEIPLELGGNPTDPNNLWLEPYPRAHVVDQLENQLRTEVCGGTLTLRVAQEQIVYVKHHDG